LSVEGDIAMVKTKSVYDPVDPSDGDRILVTRYWPRGISKERLCLTEWRRELAPNKLLLRDWKTRRISWDEYTIRYGREMVPHQQAISELAKRAKEHTITLLCFEREGNPHCRRHLLKKMIAQFA
jgi:uncharacterized protein YeaO (DUF488 family)